ncbi:class I SAM-dependent methyltransferase [candidate division WOR-3 bacterium]|nr:class I SAM-dependent methyltransferase [candidate division WOR-3 bacterium]
MAEWNDLFLDKEFIDLIPQTEIHRFIVNLQKIFQTRKVMIWDQCCGAGRHTVLAAKLGCDVYSSDVSKNGTDYLRCRLDEENLGAKVKIADMTKDPWENKRFHGVMVWDAIHHNTIGNIRKAFDIIYDRLQPGGQFLCTLMSDKSKSYALGSEIEKNTFVQSEGPEAGVPHHYFDEAEVTNIFQKWKKLVLSEKEVRYVETAKDFYKTNPFGYTKWEILLEK